MIDIPWLNAIHFELQFIFICLCLLQDIAAKILDEDRLFLARIAVNFDLKVHRVNLRRENKEVFDIFLFFNIEPYTAVKAAIGQIVDDIAKRRNSRVLRGIKFHTDLVFFIELHYICDLKAERRIAA